MHFFLLTQCHCCSFLYLIFCFLYPSQSDDGWLSTMNGFTIFCLLMPIIVLFKDSANTDWSLKLDWLLKQTTLIFFSLKLLLFSIIFISIANSQQQQPGGNLAWKRGRESRDLTTNLKEKMTEEFFFFLAY